MPLGKKHTVQNLCMWNGYTCGQSMYKVPYTCTCTSPITEMDSNWVCAGNWLTTYSQLIVVGFASRQTNSTHKPMSLCGVHEVGLLIVPIPATLELSLLHQVHLWHADYPHAWTHIRICFFENFQISSFKVTKGTWTNLQLCTHSKLPMC